MEALLVTHIIEAGFVLPLAPAGPEMTEQGALRLLRLAGIDRQLQYFRVSLTDPKRSRNKREVLVVDAHQPALSDAALELNAAALSTHFSECVLAFVLRDRTGWASVGCAEGASDGIAAAAVASVKVSAGWDESSPIVVDVGPHQFEVVMMFREQQWFARVQPCR